MLQSITLTTGDLIGSLIYLILFTVLSGIMLVLHRVVVFFQQQIRQQAQVLELRNDVYRLQVRLKSARSEQHESEIRDLLYECNSLSYELEELFMPYKLATLRTISAKLIDISYRAGCVPQSQNSLDYPKTIAVVDWGKVLGDCEP